MLTVNINGAVTCFIPFRYYCYEDYVILLLYLLITFLRGLFFVGKFRLLVLLCFALWSNSWIQVRFPLTVGSEILYRVFHDLWTLLQEVIS